MCLGSSHPFPASVMKLFAWRVFYIKITFFLQRVWDMNKKERH